MEPMAAIVPYLIYIVLFLLLFYCSIEDIRFKQIRVRKLFVAASFLILLLFIRNDLHPIEGVGGALLGMCFVGMGKATRGHIGTGDGIMILVLGLGVGIRDTIQILLYALFLAAGYAIYLIIKNWNRRKPRFAFLPFLFAGFIITLLIEAVIS